VHAAEASGAVGSWQMPLTQSWPTGQSASTVQLLPSGSTPESVRNLGWGLWQLQAEKTKVSAATTRRRITAQGYTECGEGCLGPGGRRCVVGRGSPGVDQCLQGLVRMSLDLRLADNRHFSRSPSLGVGPTLTAGVHFHSSGKCSDPVPPVALRGVQR
jgi:hypothetical protein